MTLTNTLSDPQKAQTTYLTYSSIVLNQFPNLASTRTSFATNSDANLISYDSYSFIDTKKSPWLILPLLRLRIGLQDSEEMSGYLDIFTTTPLSLQEDQASIQALKKIIPEFLSGWLLYVRFFL